jgi:serine/threonine-protein kinase
LNWLYDKPFEFENNIYDFQTEIYFVGKLFEALITEYDISGFRYNELLKKMIIKSRGTRIKSFSHIQDTIINDSYIFEDYFSYDEKTIFQEFMDQIVKIYSSIGTNSKYIDNMDQLIVELEEVLKTNILENRVQNNLDMSRLFIKGDYKYYPKSEVSIYLLKDFIRLLKSCNSEKKNILRLAITNRLRTIKKTEVDDSFTTDIPF